tara:strand:- start:100 stop:342 length:243 start_codon:yes stop_codon:yes gene_type:complete
MLGRRNQGSEMQIGDLVKYKWVTFATRRRAKLQGTDINAIGVIVEVEYKTDPKEYTQFLVQFPDESKLRRCTQSNLEKVE